MTNQSLRREIADQKEDLAQAHSRMYSIKVDVLNVYLLLAFLSLTVFGLLHLLVEHNMLVGNIELIGAVTMILIGLGVRATRNVTLGGINFLATLLTLLMVMLITGGTEHTGVYWFFIFPISAFFLTGTRQGIWWVSGLVASILATALLSELFNFVIAYSWIEIRQLLVVIVVVAIGTYIYQDSRETSVREQLQIQHDLLAERTRADTILENIVDGVVSVDDQGRVITINPAAEAMLGWSYPEIAGKRFVDIVPAEDIHGAPIESSHRPLHRLLKESSMKTATLNYRCKDGSLLPVMSAGKAIVINGKVQGAINTFRDIRVEQATERAKTEFVTLASHQLRTPISAIAWFAEMLLHGDAGKMSEEQSDYVKQIYLSNERSAAMVHDMLLVANLELNNITIQPTPIDLPVLSRHLLTKLMKRLPIGREFHITEHYQPKLPKLLLDRNLAKILLHNLFSNAIKYSRPGGNVTITIEQSKKKLSPNSKGSVIIAVADEGYGIPKNQQDKIFVKLFRASNIKEKDTDGTGLGLYTVKLILEQAGGEITFSSQENKGSTFTVLLPLEGMRSKKPTVASEDSYVVEDTDV